MAVHASATTPPPTGNGKENKKTNKPVPTAFPDDLVRYHHRLRAHCTESDCCCTHRTCASCIPYFHAVGSKVFASYTPISLRPPTHPRIVTHDGIIIIITITRVVFLQRRLLPFSTLRKSNRRRPSAYKQNMSCIPVIIVKLIIHRKRTGYNIIVLL